MSKKTTSKSTQPRPDEPAVKTALLYKPIVRADLAKTVRKVRDGAKTKS